ncbi:hypothetical protein GCM10017687_26620 [Streptomyces echinatus]|uniref:Uncharacterized protein n=1 Tax=Streptomyces echinatus TaxID=67293 RepID=A0A7W9PSK7_9ACTN|nr:hypothetical protein [Streptomyces echinatus]
MPAVRARAVPLLADAVSFLLCALLVRSRPALPRPVPQIRESLLRQVRAGASYIFRDRVLLGLALRPAVGNIAFLAVESVLALFAHDRLGIDTYGLGLFLTAEATGGLLGAGIASSLRQAIVPAHLMGRVASTSRMPAVCAAPIGAFLGGRPATTYDIRTLLYAAAVLPAQESAPELLRRLLPRPAASKAEEDTNATGGAPVKTWGGEVTAGWGSRRSGFGAGTAVSQGAETVMAGVPPTAPGPERGERGRCAAVCRRDPAEQCAGQGRSGTTSATLPGGGPSREATVGPALRILCRSSPTPCCSPSDDGRRGG